MNMQVIEISFPSLLLRRATKMCLLGLEKVFSHLNPVIVVFRISARAYSPGSQPEKHGSDQLSETGGVHRFLVRLSADGENVTLLL